MTGRRLHLRGLSPLLLASVLVACGSGSSSLDRPDAADDAVSLPDHHAPDAHAHHDASSPHDSGHKRDTGGDAQEGGLVRDGGDGSAEDGPSGDAGDGSAMGDGGDGGRHGDGGDGGAIAALGGLAMVSGGVKASSPNYQLITTTGQSPGGNGTMSSPRYRLTGGVVGATQGH
jgi:hypothetical protein